MNIHANITWCICDTFWGYAMYIFGIYIVYTKCNMRIYSTRWLVLPVRRRAGSHSTGSNSNHIRVVWTSYTVYFLLEKGIKYHTRNIPGIFKVYLRYILNAGPWTSC